MSELVMCYLGIHRHYMEMGLLLQCNGVYFNLVTNCN